MQLLGVGEIEERVRKWLEAAKLSRSHCGRWVFTWNAFKIECDPQSVLKMLEGFDLRSLNLREGEPYEEYGAAGPGTLVRREGQSESITYFVEMAVDADTVRRARAEADVVAGEITGEPVTLGDALRERANESISGTIEVAFTLDREGSVSRKDKVTILQTKTPDGETETETRTETIVRRPVEGAELDSSESRPRGVRDANPLSTGTALLSVSRRSSR
jgi:hypothetical protein